MAKPFAEDKNIEEIVSGQKYGKRQSFESTVELDNDAVDLVTNLIEKVHQLENKVSKLEKEQEEYKLHNLLDQNEISRMELGDIFELNDEIEPTTLEGLLSEFVDEKENSLEMIRSVRDRS